MRHGRAGDPARPERQGAARAGRPRHDAAPSSPRRDDGVGRAHRRRRPGTPLPRSPRRCRRGSRQPARRHRCGRKCEVRDEGRSGLPRPNTRYMNAALAPGLRGAAILFGAALTTAAPSSSITGAAATTTQARPGGPSAHLSRELTGGNGVFIGTAIPVNLKRAGYVQHEYAASGTATSYTATAPLSSDGLWSFAPDAQAPYRTRVLERQPVGPARFSGRSE